MARVKASPKKSTMKAASKTAPKSKPALKVNRDPKAAAKKHRFRPGTVALREIRK